MSNLDDRCRAKVRALEWSVNLLDCKGDRCPECGQPQPAQWWSQTTPCSASGHLHCCGLGKLCDDLRLVDRAASLVAGEER